MMASMGCKAILSSIPARYTPLVKFAHVREFLELFQRGESTQNFKAGRESSLAGRMLGLTYLYPILQNFCFKQKAF